MSFYIGIEQVSGEVYAEHLAKFGITLRPVQLGKMHLGPRHQVTNPVPYADWPIWAKALNQFSKPEDKGVGDVVARMIGSENSAAFKAWYFATFGKPCGCTGRQARFNRDYPLP